MYQDVTTTLTIPRKISLKTWKFGALALAACLVAAIAVSYYENKVQADSSIGNVQTPAAPGDLDLSFGSGGKVITPIGSSHDYANSVAIQVDGKIVAAGRSNGANYDFAVVRYNTDGTLDTSFGGTGKVVTPVGSYSVANSVAIQTDGKIVVAGNSFNGANIDFAVVRYNTNGTLDTSFNGTGKVVTAVGGGYDSAQSVAIQADGKIVAAGGGYNDADVDFAVVRYNTNGTLDTSFGGTGKVVTPIDSNSGDLAQSVAIQSDGKIVAAGYSIGSTDGDFAVVRYNTNGSLDTSFNGTGKVVTPVGSSDDYARAVAIQSDGKIVAAGSSYTGQNNDFAVVRYNTDGTLDTSFNGTGKVVTPIGSSSADYAASVAIHSDGKIVAAGASYNPAGADFAVVRYNTNGALDTSFNGTGKVVTPFGSFDDVASSVAIQPDGKIVAAGYSVNGADHDFALVRYLGGSNIRTPFDFDGDRKTDLSIFRPGPGEWWYNRSLDGGNRAFQFGAGTDTIAPADFTGDGKTDVAFFRPSTGQWFVLRSEDLSFYAFPFGTNGDVPVPADYDADGKADAAVFRPSTLTWFIQKSGGGTDIIGFGAAGDVPTVADYDGDGKADIAIYRPNATGGAQWWVRRSSNGSVFALQFGTPTDRTVQGDYTGDGKADIAFWRPSTGGWFVLRSEDFSFFSFPFGTNGDIPVPGDYDGDGRNDAAVFRPSSSTWFAQRSTAGTLIQQFGIAGDIPLPSAYVR